jgi:hypothetical protein
MNDSFYLKYIKYKTKYLELKGGLTQQQKAQIEREKLAAKAKREIAKEALKPSYILFMFLGGLPDTDHWKKFLETSNDKLICIVHPKDLPYEIPSIWQSKFRSNQLLIVNEDHHLKTSWATKSLSDAQLMMMQYALATKGNIFKKYVLLSANDAPLYNFHVIYKELMRDNKSWFSYFYNWKQLKLWKKIYNHEGGLFNFEDIDTISQWNTIDQTHLSFYLNIYEKTYKKSDNIVDCNGYKINYIKAINPESIYQKYLDSINSYGSNKLSLDQLKNIDKNGFCILTDTMFFSAIFKYQLRIQGKNFWDHIRFQEISYLDNEKNHLQYIKPIKDEIKENNIRNIENHTLKAYIRSNSWDKSIQDWQGNYRGFVSKNNRIWFGDNIAFNSDKTKLNIIENSNYKNGSDLYGDKKWFLFERISNNELQINNYNDKEIISIYPDIKDTIIPKIQKQLPDCTNTQHFSKYKLEDQKTLDEKKSIVQSELENIIRLPAVKDPNSVNNHNIKLNKSKLEKMYGINNSYADSSLISLNPKNILRDFDYIKLTKTELSSFKYSESFLINDPYTNITTILKEFNDKGIKIVHTPEIFLLNPRRHPMEYYMFSLTEIINAYNILVLFEILAFKKMFDKKCSFINENILKDPYRNYTDGNYTDGKITLTNHLIKIIYERPDELKSKDISSIINNFKERVGIHSKINRKDIPNIQQDTYLKAFYYYDRMIQFNIKYLNIINDGDKKYYCFKEEVSPDIKFCNNYGTPISSFFLNNALTNGSLFIRKVNKTSEMEIYSNQLFELKDYVHNLTSEQKSNYFSRKIIKHTDVPYKHIRTPKDIINIETIKLPYIIPNIITEIKSLSDNDLIIIYFLKEHNWNFEIAINCWNKLCDD